MFATFKLKIMDNDKDIDMRYNDTVILEKIRTPNGKYNIINQLKNYISLSQDWADIIQIKLHFITLNYILNYTCTINYKSCYTLHLDVKLVVNLGKNIKFRVQSVIKNIVLGSKV